MKSGSLLRSGVVVCAATVAGSAHATLLTDGSFDLATTGTTTSNSPWQLVVNQPDGFNRAAQFQTGFANANNTGVGGTQPPGTGTGVWVRSFEGNQGNTGEPLAQMVLTQSVFAAADGDYVLDFVAGREVNFIARVFEVTLSTNSQSVTIDLLAAAIPDGNLGGAATATPGGTPFQLILPGVTTGELVTVTATVLDGEDSQVPGGQSAYLDDFELNVIPEPGSLALLGLGGLAFLRRRR